MKQVKRERKGAKGSRWILLLHTFCQEMDERGKWKMCVDERERITKIPNETRPRKKKG